MAFLSNPLRRDGGDRNRLSPGGAALATLGLIGGLHVAAALGLGAGERGWADYGSPALNEYWQVAAALIEGRGFSDPFGAGSAGSTAWVAPLPVWLHAAILGVAGEPGRAFVVAGVVKALGYALTAWLWCDAFGRVAGRAGAGVFTVVWLGFLAAGQGRHLWNELHDPWLVGLVLAGTFWAWPGAARAGARRWVAVAVFALGPLLGPVVALVQATLVAVRVALCAARGGPRLAWRAGARPLRVLIAAMLITAGAWTARNRVALGAWIPIKSNGGYEAWQAQCATPVGVPGAATFLRHPFIAAVEREAWAREGERAYVARHAEMFGTALAEHPGDFGRRVLRRAQNAFVRLDLPSRVGEPATVGAAAWRGWVGVGLAGVPALAALAVCVGGWRGRGPRAAELGWAAGYLVYLAPYVLISHYARYQAPLAGLQAALVAWMLVVAWRAGGKPGGPGRAGFRRSAR